MQAAELARALRNLPADVKKYKTIAAFEEQAITFLDRAAAGAPQDTAVGAHLLGKQHLLSADLCTAAWLIMRHAHVLCLSEG